MKITQNIDFGLRQMLLPFSKWLKDVGSYSVRIKPCKDTRDCIDVEFEFYHKDNPFVDVEIPDNEEIRHICETYYNEECLSDLIHNQLLDPIVYNMQQYGLEEITETL